MDSEVRAPCYFNKDERLLALIIPSPEGLTARLWPRREGSVVKKNINMLNLHSFLDTFYLLR